MAGCMGLWVARWLGAWVPNTTRALFSRRRCSIGSIKQIIDLHEFLLLLGSHLELICQFRSTPPLQRQHYSREPTARSGLRTKNGFAWISLTLGVPFGTHMSISDHSPIATTAIFSRTDCSIKATKTKHGFHEFRWLLGSQWECSEGTILCKALLERRHRNNEDSGQFSSLLGSHFEFICQFRTTPLLQPQHYSLQGAAWTKA